MLVESLVTTQALALGNLHCATCVDIYGCCKCQIDAMQRVSRHMWSTHHIWFAVLLVLEPVLLTGLLH